jgi:hypothetical protein
MTSFGFNAKRKFSTPAAGKSSAAKSSAAPTAAPAAAAPARPAAGSVHVTTTLSHEAVAKLAYEIWVKKGRVPGRDQENWREAEAQLSRAGARQPA